MERVENVIVNKKFNDSVVVKIGNKNFDKEFDQIEDTTIAISVKQTSQHSGISLGMVIYAEPTFYSADKDKNEDIHLPGVTNKETRDLYIFILSSLFFDHYGVKPKQIVFGHEHGFSNGKCHLQICVLFNQSFRSTVKPGFFTVDFPVVAPLGIDQNIGLVRFLYMAQKAKNPRALLNYCMKDGDFFYSDPSAAIQYVHKKNAKGELTDKIDAFATVVKNRTLMDVSQAKDLILTHEPRTGITLYKNIESALNSEMAKSLPSFEWRYPEYLLNRYPTIERWFNQWCKPDDLSRRKALLLYSDKRCMGKTEFSLSLVNDPAYVVIFRNSFVDSVKDKQPKLLILDDMSPYSTNNKETWKALVASQPTAIRDAYMNYNWEFRVPCIITTNNLFLVQQLYRSKDFNTQVVFQEISEYMGPDGTQPQGMFEVEANFTLDTSDKLIKMMSESEEKFLIKKTLREEQSNFSLSNELMKAKQEIIDLKLLLSKKKQ